MTRRCGFWTIFALVLASASVPAAPPEFAEAIFAGGCFWSMEATFERVRGVVSVISGYTGGTVKNPTYEQVGRGTTGHVEAVRVRFDPAKVSYAQLLDVYWHNIDPTDAGGQFCDRGEDYRTVIFVGDAGERNAAETSKRALEASGQLKLPVVTEIRDAGPFYLAESDHQDFYKKNPTRYHDVEFACGRARRLAAIWGRPTK